MSAKRTNGTGAVAARPAIDAPIPGALLAALRAAVGRLSLVDTSLPRGRCASADREAIFACCADISSAQEQFLGRFRQSGGHRPTHLLRADRQDPAAWAGVLSTIDRSHHIVVYADSDDHAQGLRDLVQAGISLLIRDRAHGQPATEPSGASRRQARRVIALRDPGNGQTFLWIVEAGAFDAVREALPLKPARQRRTTTAGSAVPPDAAFTLATPADVPANVALAASTLIHDGGYRSESKGDYSWLWTGPSNHFRVLVTGIPRAPVKLHVSVIKTEDARNLSDLRVLVDGRHVPHRLESWSDLSGKVTVELGARDGDMTVLSLVHPHVVPDSAGRRLLGLCIDRIDLSP